MRSCAGLLLLATLANPLPGHQERTISRSAPSYDRCLLALEQANEEGYDFGDVGSLQTVYLPKKGYAQEWFGLKRGVAYRFVAAGGSKDTDANLSILDPGGNVVVQNFKVGITSQIDYSPSLEGRYSVKVELGDTTTASLDDVSLLCAERTSYVNKRPSEAAAWLRGEKWRFNRAQDTATRLLTPTPVPPTASPGKPIPWFMLVTRVRRKDRPASTGNWSQSYGSATRVALAGEGGAVLEASVIDDKNQSIRDALPRDDVFDLSVPASTVDSTRTGFGVKNHTARDVYIAAYIGQDGRP